MAMTSTSNASAGSSGLLPESTVCYTFDSPWAESVFNHRNPLHSTLPLLLLQMTLIITLTGLLRFILRPLKQPAIISEILAGIILGPSLLGRYPLFKTKLFPPHAWTITRTFGIVGVLLHAFNESLKQDLQCVLNSGKKEIIISFSGYFVSHISTFVLGRSLIRNGYLSKDINRVHLLDSMAGVLSLTTFPVLRPILAEFNLSTSELGRLSMTLAIINTLLGTTLTMVYSSIRHANVGAWRLGFYHFISNLSLVALLYVVARPVMLYFIRKTPEGRRMASTFVNCAMLVVMIAGLMSDMLGSVVKGPIWLAFMIPPGPPLASAFVDKTELICRVLLVPFFFATNGQRLDLGAIKDWKTFCALQLIFFVACVGKFIGTFVPALYFRMPFRDSMALGVAMCFKGILELVTFTDWLHFGVLDATQLASLEVSLLAVTAISSPCLRGLARRRPRSWNSNHWRCVAQIYPESEFRLLVCVHDKDDAPAILHLVNAYNTTKKRPVHLFLLHLVDLVGRGIPMLIPHKKTTDHNRAGGGGGGSGSNSKSNPIISAFEILEQHNSGGGSAGCFVVHPFTSVAPNKSMHEDVYKVASDNRVSLIIVPFRKDATAYSTHCDAGVDVVNGWQGRIVARKVLEEAPCSVGILVDTNRHVIRLNVNFMANFSYHIGLVFLGGADDREALAYASHMVDKPGVSITLLRVVFNRAHDHHHQPGVVGLDGGYDQLERELDDEFVGEFRLKTHSHDTVVYREVLVDNVEELVGCLRTMGNDFNLMMTGRYHGGHADVEVALSTWSETEELGVIGDFLSSADFAANSVSVLVVQQRTLAPLLAIDTTANTSSRRKK
ncbi:hypothetical protein H6P81_016404 [Aristolochia fimbriata]|uniref:Cation/H+ exchanger domain-containing protein n=1 Tax=Aristolochia fimbriata TaxID=158543 RepID=A0AAV7E8W4_ARIFI|nr:hypothetical protein H6P81_016404 [Aristolochia fimbriata]